MKATCCKEFLHKRQRQSGFHCLISDLKTSNDLLFMALGTKDHILGAKYTIFYYFWISTIKFTARPEVVWNIYDNMEDIFHDTWRNTVKELVKFNS